MTLIFNFLIEIRNLIFLITEINPIEIENLNRYSIKETSLIYKKELYTLH